MQHVSALTDKTTISTSSQRFQTERLDGGRVKRIFALMQANYGSRWVQQTGTGRALELSQQVWAEKLAGLTDEQIKHGFNHLPDDFPPTPSKFKKLCQSVKEGLSHNTAAYKPFDRSRALELKADKEKAKAALSEIRQSLGQPA